MDELGSQPAADILSRGVQPSPPSTRYAFAQAPQFTMSARQIISNGTFCSAVPLTCCHFNETTIRASPGLKQWSGIQAQQRSSTLNTIGQFISGSEEADFGHLRQQNLMDGPHPIFLL